MRQLTIRGRLIVLLLAVWLPAVIGFSLLAAATYRQEEEGARRQVQDLAEALNGAIERELNTRVALAQAFGMSSAAVQGDVRRFHQEAAAALRDSSNWAVLVDRDRQLANTRIPYDEFKPLTRIEGAPLTERDPIVWFAERGTVHSLHVVTAYAPVGVTERARYNVGVSFEPRLLQDVLVQHAANSKALVTIIDARQHIVARSRDPEKWIFKTASSAMSQLARDRQSGFFQTKTLDGVDSLTYLAPSNRYGWTAVIAFPEAELAAASARATGNVILAAAVLLAISVVLAWISGRGIAGPVRALQRAAAQVGESQVPPALATGVREVDQVAAVLHAAGRRALESTQVLEDRIADAVAAAKQAQAQLLEGQKHEAIGRLSAGIAHDFNNLLQTISTANYLLSKHVTEGPVHRALLGSMRATARGADLVRQMAAFGRAQPLQPAVVKLDDALLQSQDLTRQAIGSRIELSASIAPGLPALYVDPVQLELALLNVVLRARDAMPEGGHIHVRGRLATKEECHALSPGRYVCVEVTDDGAGMSDDSMHGAFEPYGPHRKPGAASGLGLAQVRAFATQSGGDARIERGDGAGTRVQLILPAAERNGGVTTIAEPAPMPRRSLSILMAEDDVLVSSVVEAALADAGHRIVVCTSADEALGHLQGPSRFDVLVTDVVMPGHMGGLDLLNWCQLHRPALPVIIVTGYSAQEPRWDVPVLRKPYSIEALLKTLDVAMQGAGVGATHTRDDEADGSASAGQRPQV